MDVRELRQDAFHVIEGDLEGSSEIFEFPGKVLIRGDVLDGCLIWAASHVEVLGYVGAAGIHAGGNIRIHKGIAGEGYLDARGTIMAQFVNNSQLVATGDICVTTSAMHSVLCSEGSICIQGREGFLVGGTLMAASRLVATRVGSIYRTPTYLRVGMSPLFRQELVRLQEEIEALRDRFEALMRDIHYLESAGSASAYAERLPLYRFRAVHLERRIEKQRRRYSMTHRALQKTCCQGEIEIHGPIHPGVSVSIGWSETTLDRPMECVRFFETEGRIQWSDLAPLKTAEDNMPPDIDTPCSPCGG